jgi:hypothetical protein
MNLRDALRSTRPGDAHPPDGGPVQVMIALRVAGAAAEQALSRLGGLGLTVERAIGSKVVGSVRSEHLDALKADPDVEEVQTSVRLAPHQKP